MQSSAQEALRKPESTNPAVFSVDVFGVLPNALLSGGSMNTPSSLIPGAIIPRTFSQRFALFNAMMNVSVHTFGPGHFC
jgi:hypothetical protein